MARVLPHLILWTGYVIVYSALGYGARSSGFYLSVAQQPWQVLHNLLTSAPIYLGALLVIPYAAFAGLLSSGSWPLVLVSLVLLALLTPMLLVSLRMSREARFFAVAATTSVAALAPTVPQERLACLAAFATSGLLSVCLAESVRTNACERRQQLLFVLHTVGALAAFIPLSTACLWPALVLSVNARGAPTAAHFEFDAALEDPRVLWLRFDGRRAVRWTPPVIGSVEHMPAAATIF